MSTTTAASILRTRATHAIDNGWVELDTTAEAAVETAFANALERVRTEGQSVAKQLDAAEAELAEAAETHDVAREAAFLAALRARLDYYVAVRAASDHLRYLSDDELRAATTGSFPEPAELTEVCEVCDDNGEVPGLVGSAPARPCPACTEDRRNAAAGEVVA